MGWQLRPEGGGRLRSSRGDHGHRGGRLRAGRRRRGGRWRGGRRAGRGGGEVGLGAPLDPAVVLPIPAVPPLAASTGLPPSVVGPTLESVVGRAHRADGRSGRGWPGRDRAHRCTGRSSEVGAGQLIAGRSAARAGDQHKGNHEEQGGRDRNRRHPRQATLPPGSRQPRDNLCDIATCRGKAGACATDFGPRGAGRAAAAGGLEWREPGQRS